MDDRSDDNRDVDHGEELSLVVSADEARAIDNWSAAHHIGDRSEAVHRLVSIWRWTRMRTPTTCI